MRLCIYIDGDNAMRVPEGQGWFIDCMKQSGYFSNVSGICNGLSHMGMQAMHSGSRTAPTEGLETFNKRLLKIHEIYHAVSQEVMNNEEDEEDFRIKLISRLKNEFLDMLAFFEGVELYQNPAFYPQLFEERPKAFDSGPVLSVVQSIAIEPKKISVVSSGVFVGVYKKNDLITYVRTLSETISAKSFTHPVSLILQSSNHAITVGYDPMQKKWFLVDANKLPTQSFQTNEEIAQAILGAFSKNDAACFSTKIYAPESQHIALNSIIGICTTKNEWEEIHKITRNRATLLDSYGASLVHIAAREGRKTELMHLYENGADLSAVQTSEGVSPLCYAVIGGQLKVSQWLLEMRSIFNTDPNKAMHNEDTPLCIAAQYDDVETLKLLLSHKADELESGSGGLYPIHIAAARGSIKVLSVLLNSHYADPNQCTIGSRPLFLDTITPLFYAAQNDHLEAVNLLIKNGADPNKARYTDDATPLHVAAWQGNFKVVEALLAAGADPDLKMRNGSTAFDLATEQGHSALANLFVAHKSRKGDVSAEASKPSTESVKTAVTYDIPEKEIERILSIQGDVKLQQVARQVLGISKDELLTEESIKKAYRKISLLVHPDKVTQELRGNADTAFKKLGAANETLRPLIVQKTADVSKTGTAANFSEARPQQSGATAKQGEQAAKPDRHETLWEAMARDIDKELAEEQKKFQEQLEKRRRELSEAPIKQLEEDIRNPALPRHELYGTTGKYKESTSIPFFNISLSTPGPELKAIKDCVQEFNERRIEKVPRSEILKVIQLCQDQKGAKSHRAKILMDPNSHLDDKSGVSKIIREIGEKYNAESHRLQEEMKRKYPEPRR